MGTFLSLSCVIGKAEHETKNSLKNYAKSVGGGLQKIEGIDSDTPNCCIINELKNNTSIFYPDGYSEWENSSRFISKELNAAVFAFHIHDGDLWMYVLYYNGEIIDRFNPVPDYWDIPEEEVDSWKGNAKIIADHIPWIKQSDIEKYLVRWDLETAETIKAYPTDEYGQEDWQLIDFLNKLKLPYPVNDDLKGHTYKFWTKELKAEKEDTFLGRKIIDAKAKQKITNDWKSFFPGFQKYEPMWLLRRNGPFLCGIHLYGGGSGFTEYEPLFHVFNLMVDFPVIHLGSNIHLLNRKSARDGVTLLQHEDNYNNYAERLKNQVSLLQKDSFSCDELVLYMKARQKDNAFCVSSLESIVLALFWCGRIKQAEKELKNAKKIISRWGEGVLRGNIGVKEWEQKLQQQMDMDTLKKTVESQICKFKLEKIIDYQFYQNKKEFRRGFA